MSIGYMESGELVECSTIEQLHEEEEARIASDQQLQDNIDAEAGERANSDSDLQAAIDAEAAARLEADEALQSNIDSEAMARAAADEAMQAGLTTEATTRASQDSLLQANMDTININVSGISSSVGSMAVTVAELSNTLTSEKALIESKLQEETAAREEADAAINGHIEGLPPEGVDAYGVWHIYTPEGFKAWRDAANNDGSIRACLHSSIDMDGVEWEPVAATFTGYFDGGGYSIKNLSWEGKVDSTDIVARGLLVNEMESGLIHGVTLISPKITFENTNASTSNYLACGLVAGRLTGTTALVRDCHVFSGEVSATTESGNCYAAGIAGYSGGDISSCKATSCTMTATSESGSYYAGGIVGYSGGDISSCKATSCTLATTSESGGCYVGGIAGGSDGDISSCKATSCTMAATSESSNCYVGGIAGYSGGDISSCEAGTCVITATSVNSASTDSGGTFSGGITGYSRSNAIAACISRNNQITVTTEYGSARAGGIIGQSGGSPITGCIVCTNRSAYHDNDYETYIYAKSENGYACAGGIVGGNRTYPIITGCVVQPGEWRTMKIEAVSGTSEADAGGIIGRASITAVLGCAVMYGAGDNWGANANTAVKIAASSTSGSTYIGGIAGYVSSSSTVISGNLNLSSAYSVDVGNW